MAMSVAILYAPQCPPGPRCDTVLGRRNRPGWYAMLGLAFFVTLGGDIIGKGCVSDETLCGRVLRSFQCLVLKLCQKIRLYGNL